MNMTRGYDVRRKTASLREREKGGRGSGGRIQDAGTSLCILDPVSCDLFFDRHVLALDSGYEPIQRLAQLLKA
jgi:hypothetical protein